LATTGGAGVVILSRYVGGLFLTRVLWFLVGLSGLMLGLDLLDRAAQVLSRGDGGAGAALYYLSLRAPAIANQLLPLAVLLGGLTTLLGLARHNEIVAMKGVGMSFYRMLGALLPAAALIGAAQFVVADQVLPRADRTLHAWWQATAPPSEANAERTWMRAGDTVAAFDKVALDGRRVEGVSLFRRDAVGQLVERVIAGSAEFDDEGWMLRDVRRLRVGSPDAERTGSFLWQTRLTPRDLADAAIQNLRHSTAELIDLIARGRPGSAAMAGYLVELHKKLAAPAACLLMLLIAAPVAQGLERHGAKGMQLVIGIVVGFVYLLTDGVLALLGEAGTVTPAFAAWAPTLLFAGAGGSILLAVER
jgi:lipopolysaccharide export system permease protein